VFVLVDEPLSNHKKPFISAPEHPRTVLNAFLNCMYFLTFRSVILRYFDGIYFDDAIYFDGILQ
jgi:hypothetical protein